MKVKLSENQYKIYKEYLKENQESDSQKKAIEFLIDATKKSKNSCEEFIRKDLRKIFPILNGNKKSGKFTLGALRLYVDECSNSEDYNKVNLCVETISNNEDLYKKYDKNLNGLSIENLYDEVKKFIVKRRKSRKKTDVNSDYKIVKIGSFEEAEEYSDYTSWCITHSDNAYENYTDDGINQFYFCLKKGFENLDYDDCFDEELLGEYGLSMIAVSVDPYGKLKTCTCRWNHDKGGNDHVLSVEEIEKITGYNFDDTFKPNEKGEKYIKNIKLMEKSLNKITKITELEKLIKELNKMDNSHYARRTGNYIVTLRNDYEDDYFYLFKRNDENVKFWKKIDNNTFVVSEVGVFCKIVNTSLSTYSLYNLKIDKKIEKYGKINWIAHYETDNLNILAVDGKNTVFLDCDTGEEIEEMNNSIDEGYEIMSGEIRLVGSNRWDNDRRILQILYFNKENGDIKQKFYDRNKLVISNSALTYFTRNLIIFQNSEKFNLYDTYKGKLYEFEKFDTNSYMSIFENCKDGEKDIPLILYVFANNGSSLVYKNINEFYSGELITVRYLKTTSQTDGRKCEFYVLNGGSTIIKQDKDSKDDDKFCTKLSNCKLLQCDEDGFVFIDSNYEKNSYDVESIDTYGYDENKVDIDSDGVNFKTVTIGNQTWMAENLDINVGKGESVNGKYGKLYTFKGANEAADKVKGWHIPTIEEWNTLCSSVGSDAATKLKTTSEWKYDANGTDDYGYGVLPDGYYYGGSYNAVGSCACFWTSNEGSKYNAYYKYFNPGTSVDEDYSNKKYYYSVRLVKN